MYFPVGHVDKRRLPLPISSSFGFRPIEIGKREEGRRECGFRADNTVGGREGCMHGLIWRRHEVEKFEEGGEGTNGG